MAEQLKTHAPAPKSATPARTQASPKGAFFHSPETRATQSPPFFQTALEVSQPGDKHEVEADRMADHVVESQSVPKTDSFFAPAVQREPEISRVAFESQREESLQRKEEEEIPKEKNSESSNLQRSPASSQPPATPTFSRTRNDRSAHFERPIQLNTTSQIFRRSRPGHYVIGNARINPSRARGPPSVGPSFEQTLRSTKGGGSPMSSHTRGEMESSFNADFGKVRIHTDSTAQKLNQNVQAKAFAHGQDIYFSPNRYQPETRTGKHLLAHELTHVVQQGHAVQRSPNSLSRAPPSIQCIPTSMAEVREEINDIADNIPGYTLGTVLIGYNPILGRDVEWSASAFFRGAAGLLPGGTKLYDKLNEGGALDDAFEWIEGRIKHHNLSWSRVKRLWSTAWDRMGITEGISGNVRIFKNVFSGFFSDIGSFLNDCIAKLTTILTTLAVGAVRTLFGDNSPAYDLMTMVLGKDPITDETREWVTVDFLRAAMDFFGFQSHREKMEETHQLQNAADWLDTQFGILKGAIGGLVAGVKAIWDTFSLATLADPLGLLNRIVQVVLTFIARMLEFIKKVATEILRLIKEALIALLKPHLNKIPGYPLLRVALGRDPITGEVIPRTADNFILGFLSFVPGGRERYQNLKKSGAIDRALNWFLVTINELGLSPATIAETFATLWGSFSIEDLMNPIPAFQRVGQTLLRFVTSVLTLVAKIALKILEFVFIGVLGPAGARVVAALKQGKNTFTKIIKNPVGFLGNLLGALGKGFTKFGKNIFKHLKAGLVGWLFGALAGSGLQLPEKFDLKGILSLVAQVLGLTYDKMRPKLVKRLGEKVVKGLEKSLEFVTLFLKEGFAGVWQKFVEWIGNLKDTVMGAIKEWIVTKIVTIAVTKLATLSNPVGAIIEAIMAIYNVVMFFIERMEQILAVVESVIKSITKIADGKLEDAANFVEKTMARTLPVIISFLARLIGLGGIAGKIKKVIAKIQKKVSKAIDKMISWIARKAKALVKKGKAGLGKLIAWWKTRKAVKTKDGKDHSILFKGTGKGARIIIKSTPTDYLTFVTDLKTSQGLTDAQITPAKTKAQAINREAAKTVPDDKKDGQAQAVNKLVDELVTLTAALPLKPATENSPPVYGPIRGGFGSFAKVAHIQAPHPQGSEPTVGNTKEFDGINLRREGKGAYYVKGHLLNDNLGGPGNTWKNLTPLTVAANGDHKNNFEKQVKIAVNGVESRGANPSSKFGESKEFSCVTSYGRALPKAATILMDEDSEALPPGFKDEMDEADLLTLLKAERNVPKEVTCTAKLTYKGGKTESKSYTVRNKINYGSIGDYSLNPTPKTNYVLADKIKFGEPTKEKAVVDIMKLKLVGKKRAIDIYDAFYRSGRINSFRATTGIGIRALNHNNKSYRIKGGTYSGPFGIDASTKLPENEHHRIAHHPREQEADEVAHTVTATRPDSRSFSDFKEHYSSVSGRQIPAVSILNNPAAHERADLMGARAFTEGAEISFNRGEFDPASERGQNLLAHELTHVAQQNPTTQRSKPDKTMKIKSTYRRPNRRISRRSNDGPFFQTESTQENFFTPSGEVKAKEGEEEAPKNLKTEEEEPVSAKEEEEPAAEKCSCEGKGECSKEEEEPVAKGPILAKGDSKSDSPDASFQHCDAKTQEPLIKMAVSSAKTMADRATGASAAMALIGGMEVPGFKPTPGQLHHQKWFGEFHQRRANGIARTFGRISKALTGKVSFSCRCKKNIYAYVFPGGRRKIYLCKKFWTAGSSGFDSKPGVILHELAHEVNLSVGDKGYGTANAEKLAKNKPRKAAHNADNFEYYAESL